MPQISPEKQYKVILLKSVIVVDFTEFNPNNNEFSLTLVLTIISWKLKRWFDEIFFSETQFHTYCGKTRNYLSFFFRQINSLVTYLHSKTVTFTEFLAKISWKQKLYTLWILRNFCITTFWKISVKTISLVTNLLYNWFHEIIIKWYKNFANSTLWKMKEFSVKSILNFSPTQMFREIDFM